VTGTVRAMGLVASTMLACGLALMFWPGSSAPPTRTPSAQVIQARQAVAPSASASAPATDWHDDAPPLEGACEH
jgi:hypothetical protein